MSSGAPAEFLISVLSHLPPGADMVVVRDGADWVVGMDPAETVTGSGETALKVFDRIDTGWWAGFLAYDLGRAVERVVPRLPDDLGLPDLALGRFDARLVVGIGGFRVEGEGPARAAMEALARRAREGCWSPAPPHLGPWSSSLPREAYEAGVRAVVALIEAGEYYQVNLTRRLSCPHPADPVALFVALLRWNPAPHAALIRLGNVAVVSASPERFLLRRGDEIETRPIKGTAADPAVLTRSAKDRAENVMIVDMARNDLGRVCEYGSIRVPTLCAPERHPGLYHLVSTVRGTLRRGVRTAALLRATFPPASITGAPKPGVLQAIEDLEACRRGLYCGAVGWIDADACSLDLNVAIRTFTVAGGGTYLGVGAGIVADSDPAGEWRETKLKTARLLAAAGARTVRPSGKVRRPAHLDTAQSAPRQVSLPRASSDTLLRQEFDALTTGICKALNDPLRLVLLYALEKRPHTVSELCEVIEAPPSNTSSHLAVLRRRGLVEAQRQGNRVVYSLRHPKVMGAIDLLRQVMNEEIARQQALRASPPPGSKTPRRGPDGPQPQ